MLCLLHIFLRSNCCNSIFFHRFSNLHFKGRGNIKAIFCDSQVAWNWSAEFQLKNIESCCVCWISSYLKNVLCSIIFFFSFKVARWRHYYVLIWWFLIDNLLEGNIYFLIKGKQNGRIAPWGPVFPPLCWQNSDLSPTRIDKCWRVTFQQITNTKT